MSILSFIRQAKQFLGDMLLCSLGRRTTCEHCRSSRTSAPLSMHSHSPASVLTLSACHPGDKGMAGELGPRAR